MEKCCIAFLFIGWLQNETEVKTTIILICRSVFDKFYGYIVQNWGETVSHMLFQPTQYLLHLCSIALFISFANLFVKL